MKKMAGNWFYLVITAAIFIPVWIKLNLFVAVIILDITMITFYGFFPEITYPVIGLLHVVAIAKGLFFKPISPSNTN